MISLFYFRFLTFFLSISIFLVNLINFLGIYQRPSDESITDLLLNQNLRHFAGGDFKSISSNRMDSFASSVSNITATTNSGSSNIGVGGTSGSVGVVGVGGNVGVGNAGGLSNNSIGGGGNISSSINIGSNISGSITSGLSNIINTVGNSDIPPHSPTPPLQRRLAKSFSVAPSSSQNKGVLIFLYMYTLFNINLIN